MTDAPLLLGVAAVCLALRVAAPLLIGERAPIRLTRALTLAVPALLAGLVIDATFAAGPHLVVDARLAGVAAGLLVALAGKPILLALALAALTTAITRALGG